MTTSDSVIRENSLETRIGLYWLHRLGIISIVLGFAFLMMYSLQYIGPVLKLLSGLFASLALIVSGALMARKDPSRWFGHGLTAGGWSLTYFTVYAAHFLPSVAVITSMPLECALLIAVAAGSFTSALKANSELMSIFSVTLAAASILLSGPSLFGDFSFLVIAVFASILVNRKSWTALFVWSMLACYAGHFYCSVFSLPFYAGHSPLAALFLSLMWLSFGVASGFSIQTNEKSRDVIAVAVCVNSFVLATGLLVANPFEPDKNALILAAAGTVYLIMTRWLLRHGHERLGTIHSLLGLTLVNCAKSMHYTGLNLLTLDIMQIAVLGLVGIKYNIRSFRWVAAGLACTFIAVWQGGVVFEYFRQSGQFAQQLIQCGFYHFEYIKTAIGAVSVMGALAHFCRQYGSTCLCPIESSRAYGRFFYITANIMAALAFINIADPAWQLLAWGALSVANHLFFVHRQDSLYAVTGLIAFVVSLFCAAQITPAWTAVPVSLLIAAFYALNRYFAWQDEYAEKRTTLLRRIYAVAATIILTHLLIQDMSANYLSLSLAVEGFLLLSVGFITRECLFRICGLTVMALLTGKLLFVDMAHYNTFGRIVSFIGAGFAFLFSSYAYARFTRAFENAETAGQDQECESQSADVDTEVQPDSGDGTVAGKLFQLESQPKSVHGLVFEEQERVAW